MAHVTMNLYATLRSYVGGVASVETKIEPGQTVGQVLERLGVPLEHARIVFVNNRAATTSLPLKGGEHIGVFPAIGGG